MFLCGFGCSSSNPDPLAGWKELLSHDYEKLDKAITVDYQDYIQKLPSEERNHVNDSNTCFLEDEAGQHAVRISIPLNGTWWDHVLIYDKGNKRIKTIKYAAGHYAC
jgi:hypothetical protein